MQNIPLICAGALLLAALVTSHPTIYKRNDDEVLSPVLVPVSSTVIPLPIYKVSSSVIEQYSDEHPASTSGRKLITIKQKKNKEDKAGASVKVITREDWGI